MTKILAFYLPQFHAIPENDAWWGKGFTDWTNVRKAKPLFAGHEQPRVPLNGNYYDLSQTDVLRWQAQLMRDYQVDGLCFYHYWFDGKLLLEKPAEDLLAHTDIQMPFCFSWANEPWARTWDGKNSTVLMPQRYGDEADWKKHFDYLLPFFQDERYIKVDGKPMFVIYKSMSMPDAKAMMDCWEALAHEQGLPGLHYVETIRNAELDARDLPFSARVEFEPVRANYEQTFWQLNYKRVRRRIVKSLNALLGTHFLHNTPFTFAEVAQRSLQKQSPKGTYGGVFIGWDNTARRALASTIVLPPTKQEFKDYLREKMRITNEVYGTDYVFINAWNEWAEGTYLEPDEKHGFDYLEAIRELKQDTK